MIYVLHDAEGNLFYVGRSIHPQTRLAVHKKRFGPNITMRIVQNLFCEETPAEAERRWMRHYSAQGCQLVNNTTLIFMAREKRVVERRPNMLASDLTPGREAQLTKIRVSPEDKALFLEQADREGLSLSSWIRMHLLRIVRESRPAQKATKRKKL